MALGIPIYPMFYLLKGDYKALGFKGLVGSRFGVYGWSWGLSSVASC